MIAPTIKVLLVEDMMMIAKITEQMLRKVPERRYASVHTTTLAATLENLLTEDFDVVLLDLNLSDSSDLETVSKVHEAAPEVPIIVLTANNSDSMGLQAVQMGAQDFLTKGDFNFRTLDRAIMYSIERHRLQRTIRQLAVLDELTGLYNRRGFNTLHADILQRVRHGSARGFLCFFDLDRFKQINDELGHAVGDEAIKEFASTLRTTFRKDSLLVRLGGDEFVAMGVEHQQGEAEAALRSLDVLLSVRNSEASILYRLESSHGLIFFDQANELSIDELSRRADFVLYEDKEKRRAARRAKNPGAPLEAQR